MLYFWLLLMYGYSMDIRAYQKINKIKIGICFLFPVHMWSLTSWIGDGNLCQDSKQCGCTKSKLNCANLHSDFTCSTDTWNKANLTQDYLPWFSWSLRKPHGVLACIACKMYCIENNHKDRKELFAASTMFHCNSTWAVLIVSYQTDIHTPFSVWTNS